MTTFRNYIATNYGLEMPEKEVPGSWFAENGFPMIITCKCCGMAMALPTAWIDDNGYCFCNDCAEAVED